MFGRAGTAAQRQERLRRQASILDSVSSEIGSLSGRLGGTDRRRMDDYLTSVREVEARVQKAERQDESRLAVPDAPLGIPASHDEHLKLMFDLMALAYQADITRVASFYTTREISQMTYPEVDVFEPHHVASHHANGPERMAMMVRVGIYYSRMMSRFLEKLASMPEGDGSVLDHSMIFYGNGLSNSDQHVHLDLPMAVFGGRFKGDRHLAYGNVPMANLWLTAAAQFDAPLNQFGNSTGRLEI
jgi:hypothetical protein